MPCNLTQRRLALYALTASACALIGCAEAAAAPAAKSDVAIAVFADYYMVGSRRIDDLNVLENAVSMSGPRAVRLDACGAAADHPQRAAAHRFRNLSLELRLLDPDAPVCRGAADARAIRASVRHEGPLGINYRIVEQWWHESMP